MADVRLTATNPEDSSVVPVACDASGRLLLEELPPAFDGTVDGDLTVSGKGTFAGGKSIIGNDGSAQFAQGAVDIYANGTVEFTQDVNFGGSATFAGDVATNGLNSSDRISVSAITDAANVFFIRKTNPDGSGISNRLVGKADGSLRIGLGGSNDPGNDLSSIATIALNATGSAEFAGGKAGFTAEGYLWCTTRRGDTVILDATSQGVGVWAEYTPTTRIDEIRDKLDANRGDTAEMPTDTP